MAEKSGSLKWLWATLMIIVLVIFGPMSLSLIERFPSLKYESPAPYPKLKSCNSHSPP